jgi:hypothetical protein
MIGISFSSKDGLESKKREVGIKQEDAASNTRKEMRRKVATIAMVLILEENTMVIGTQVDDHGHA